MTRTSLSTESVVAAASELVDREGAGALTLTQLAAHLGVKSPSLYNHVDGIDALRRLMALATISDLAEATRTAAMGRSGASALRAVAHAFRDVARLRPGTYALIQVARPGDEAWEAAAARLLEPVLAAMAGLGIEGEDAIHATRSVRCAIHGFVSLESGKGFGMDLDIDESFDTLVEVLVAGLANRV
ncbi:TetR/AcrR family transcriptional regulator [soil metagenome]